jgi:hypothetical protein
LFWVVAILFSSVGTLFENLIQLVNIVGSIFYGTVLGIFLSDLHQIRQSQSHLYSALVSQITIFFIYYYAIFVFPGEAKLGYLC